MLAMTVVEPIAEPAAPFSSRVALRVLQLGALAVVLAASTHRLFDLDRFFVAKELVLHLTAVLAGLLVIVPVSRRRMPGDRLLSLFLFLSAVSALFATNRWAGLRALLITASSLALYWVAGALAEAGLSRKVINGLALAIVVAVTTSLIQAYGGWLDIFSANRAPGGTLGNRNFVAHAAAFGFPLVLLAALQARRTIGLLLGSIGLGAVTATLVLTRSRAAWLAFGVMAFVFAVSMIFSAALRTSRKTWGRLLVLLLFIGAGVAAALLLPNALRWRSDNPYLESIKDVANYEEGSGRGRLIQYGRSMVMALHHPIFGVGPGNWEVRYAEHKAKNDPSMDHNEEGMTANPWPSSDWVAFVSERGFVAAIILALALLKLAFAAFGRLSRAAEVQDGLEAATLLATLAAAGVAGTFDAVLLLALPGLIVWSALGALSFEAAPRVFEHEPPTPPVSALRLAGFACVVLLAGVGVWRSSSQIYSMQVLEEWADRGTLEKASRIDPGNYRLQMRLARVGTKSTRCEHALAARALYPNAEAAKRAARRCE